MKSDKGKGRSPEGTNGLHKKTTKDSQNAPKTQFILNPVTSFWHEETKGNKAVFVIDSAPLIDFLGNEGFGNYFPDEGHPSVLIHVAGNVVSRVEKIHIQQYARDYIAGQPNELGHLLRVEDLKEAFARKVDQLFKVDRLNLLPNINPNFIRDTQGKAHFFFANTAAVVTQEGIKPVPMDELKGHIWKSQIIERNFTAIPEEEIHQSEFYSFLLNVSDNDPERLESLFSIIGYLLHSFKSPDLAKAVILCDARISEDPSQPNGRTGKGIIVNALGMLRKVAAIDGKTFNPQKTFGFQRVDLDTRLLFLDDVKRNFAFEAFFSVITEGISIERKHRDEIRIPFEDSPKVIISTNYVIQGQGASHEARKIEFELSDHYGLDHTPQDEFGHLFFNDWDQGEWNRFYNLMLHCVEVYLRSGIIAPPTVNLELRKLIQATNEDFLEFMEVREIPQDEWLNKNELKDEFTGCFPDYSTRITQRTFNSWLRHWATFQGLKVEEKLSNNQQLIQFYFPPDQ